MNDKELTLAAIMAASRSLMPPPEKIETATAYAAVAAHYLVTDSRSPKALRMSDNDVANLQTAHDVFRSLTTLCGNALKKDRERQMEGGASVFNLADFMPKAGR